MPVAEIYIVKPGDSLSKIARDKHVTLKRLKSANPQITDPDKIIIGDAIKIPTAEPTPVPSVIAGQPNAYDGVHPAPGTVVTQKADYNNPPLTNDSGNRAPSIYDQVINQFAVAHNPRYARDVNGTYCNIFVWDVTRAMNCEIPHWVDNHGDTAVPHASHANEININAGVNWMLNFGVTRHGWRVASARTAQNHANQGKPAVALYKNPSPTHHGHTAIVRPGSLTGQGPASAQAGNVNFNSGHIEDGFGGLPVQYFIHD
jgi:LysM repeat protein